MNLPFLAHKEFISILGAAYDEELQAHSFKRVSDRRWVRSTRPPIRDLFEITLLGIRCSPRWGFSLDFVPHIAASRVKWHRTEKSALMDVVFDPVDEDDVREWEMANDTSDREMAANAVRTSARCTVPKALEFFARVRTVEDLPATFETLLRRKAHRFGFFNYLQQPLAYAFTLAILGKREAAETWWQKALEQRGEDLDDDNKAQLRQRFDAVLQTPI